MRLISKIATLLGASTLLFYSANYMRPNNGDLPRGIRNNNPGNIRHGDNWVGMTDTQNDAEYITFKDPVFGIRAMAIILNTYRVKYNITTIEGIIKRWAPPTENDTAAYINHVSAETHVAPNVRYPQDTASIKALVTAMIKHENGVNPYTDNEILAGIEAAYHD